MPGLHRVLTHGQDGTWGDVIQRLIQTSATFVVNYPIDSQNTLNGPSRYTYGYLASNSRLSDGIQAYLDTKGPN